ncbi:DNA-directed DNA polymerase epsilon, subunit B [Suhomyces tanzawaensis NRRL Y-17324]|uniref:DNA polymerase epsilon subunit B n=1 Tax=Suhomyces tanzawaensis NRRL Y-17324 TaxID=984487 RepID=A0A1E4SNK8_9ASCO|nr:DNA-directed DNA polymerase epsilon, subunit B [Suhomyces tanzawaensis NRRL Y-17324]ODV81085.1 DNA-directed DNA polymerase epsilon, subunit B [Suhomyces tanzawaensis NRRL Y-17324]
MSTSLPIKLQPSNLRPIAYRILSKKHGLNLKTDALAILTETISYKFGFEWKSVRSQQFIEEVARIWKLEDRGLFIDGAGLKQVLKELSKKKDSEAAGETVPAVAGRSDTVVDIVEEEEVPEEVINWKDYFKVINPNQQPKYKFDRHRKQFNLVSSNSIPGHSLMSKTLESTVELFYNRYNLISDRLSRHENFQKASYSNVSSLRRLALAGSSIQGLSASNEITLIKNVLGRDGSKFILFGLLSKNSAGDFILEDSTDYIELNISQAYKAEGSFYCVGMFVIVEGIYSANGGSSNQMNDYIGGCFHVSVIGHPPAERRDVSNENYGSLDFLGIQGNAGSSSTLAKVEKTLKINKPWKKKLIALEKSLTTHKLIMLGSDCYLDSFRVMDGLKKLFGAIETSLEDEFSEPLAIIMVGSFISKPLTPTNSSVSTISNSEYYKSNFDNLANILSGFPNIIKTCKLILVPGKNDPWQTTYSLGSSNLNYLPQKMVPNVFLNRLERLFPKGNLIRAWNPFRINYLSQEILILKDDLMSKFKRNDIIFEHDLELEEQLLEKEKKEMGNDEERINKLVLGQNGDVHIPEKIKQARKLVKTLLDQGNLQPFLRSLKLIDPNYDHVLRIEPLPTVLILQDAGVENFEVTYNGCKVVNIGRLIGNSGRRLNYAEYYPSGKRFEFKEIYF